MKTFELIAPCHFGLEAVTKKEIIKLGYEVTEVTDGRVSFTGDADAIARANIFLRTTERVLLKAPSGQRPGRTSFRERNHCHGRISFRRMAASG